MRNFFHTDWFRENSKYKKTSIIFMEVLKKPVKISVAGVFDVNLTTFTKICKSAYSLFAVFKKIKWCDDF